MIGAHPDLVAAVDRSERVVTAAVDVDWWSEDADNLVANGDFEAGTSGWTGVLAGYDTAAVAQSGVRAYSGRRAMLVTWPTVGATAGAAATTTVSTVIGRKYRLQARLWVPPGAPAPQPFVFFLLAGPPAAAAGAWQLVEVVFVATLTTHTVGFSVPVAAAGQQVWVDRVRLVPYLDLSPMLVEARCSRSLNADLPDVAGIATGDISAEATVVLSGFDPTVPDAPAAADLFAPFSPVSPLWRRDRTGRPMTLDVGVLTDSGERRVRRFTGRTREVQVDPVDRTVTIKGLDLAEQLRGSAQLPVVVANAVIGAQPVKPGLNAQWLVDYLLRQGGIYASPPPRPQCVLSATLHGSAYPEIGGLVNAADIAGGTIPVGFCRGRFALATYGGPVFSPGPPVDSRFGDHVSWSAQYRLAADLTSGTADGLLAEWWAYLPTAGGTLTPVSLESDTLSGSRQKAVVELASATGFRLRWYTDAAGAPVTVTGPALPFDNAWHYLAVQISWPTATTVRATFRIDATSTTPADAAVPARTTQTPMIYLIVPAGSAGATEALQITAETPAAAAPFNNEFTPNAVLEPSMLELTVTPPGQAPQAIWDTVKDIAQAELATAGFAEDGNFGYRSRRTTPPAVTRTLTAERSLESLAVVERIDGVRNRVRASSSSWQIQPAATIWALTDTVGVDRGATHSIVATFDAPVIALVTTVSIIPTGGGGADSGYRAARQADGSGGAVTNLVITITAIGTSAARIDIANPNSFRVYLVSPSGVGYPAASNGQPALRIKGQLVTQTPQDVDGAGAAQTGANYAEASWPPSIDRVGEQFHQVPDSPWRQHPGDAQTLADDLLAALYRSVPVIEQVTCAGDPTLQLADRARLSDPQGTGVDDPVAVVGLSEQIGADGGYTQTLTVRAVAPPGGWILGDPTRSLLGTTTRL